MKPCIYLSCIIVTVLLCACKSNSFLAQRYTRYGHEHHHTSAEKNITRTTRHKQHPSVETTSTGADVFLSANAAKTEVAVLHTPAKMIFPAKAIQPLLVNGRTAFTKLKAELDTSDKQNIETKQTLKEKVYKASGLFNTLFKIVLWCIILAVLVAIILIILLA